MKIVSGVKNNTSTIIVVLIMRGNVTMNREETAAAIKVMQAYVDGKEIQFKERLKGEWQNFNPASCTPEWWWGSYDYRIKPTPVKLWVVTDAKGTYIFCDKSRACAISFCGDRNKFGISGPYTLHYLEEKLSE